MNFYIKLFKKIFRKEKVSISEFSFYFLRLLLLIFIVYNFPSYYLCALLVYRIFLSNLSLLDNNILFSKNDMYLFGFRDKALLKLFIFQKLFLNKFVFRIIYVLNIAITLIYLNEFIVLSLAIFLELVFFYLEYDLFRVNHLMREQYLNLKIIGETSFLALAGVTILVFKNISIFLIQHVEESVLILLLCYFIYVRAMIVFIKRYKQSGSRSFWKFFHRKIDIFTYKELKLFGQHLMSNILILFSSLAFFLFDKNEFTPYAVLLVISTSVLFIHKKKGIVSNLEQDTFFLNKKLFLKNDNLLIIQKKFTSYLKISIVLKLPLLIIAYFILGKNTIGSILSLLILIVLLILDEFNSFYIIGKFNFVLHYTLRYMLSIITLIYIYSNKELSALAVVIIFLVYEFYNLKLNFLNPTRHINSPELI